MPLKIWRTPEGRAHVAYSEHEMCCRSLRKSNSMPKKKKKLEKPKPETGDLDRSGPGNLKKNLKPEADTARGYLV